MNLNRSIEALLFGNQLLIDPDFVLFFHICFQKLHEELFWLSIAL